MTALIAKGLGTAKLVNKTNGLDVAETKEFLAQALEMGFMYLDTAPRYSSTDAERMLGEASDVAKNFLICSKVGKRYSKLIHPMNRIHQKVLARKSELKAWQSIFTPENLSKELEGSMRRLRREYLDIYLLHAVPPSISLDDYADALLDLKQKGLVRNIGVSIDVKYSGDLSWCDVVQTPLRGFGWVNWAPQQKVILNSVFLDSKRDVLGGLQNLPNNPADKIALIGTTSVDHLKHFAKAVDAA